MTYSSRHYAEALYEALLNKKSSERTQVLKRFLEVLYKNRQQKLIHPILAYYEKLYLEKNNMRKVDVESASTLSQEVKKEIESSIGTPILLTETVNPDLLAGMTILIDDMHYIDASARTQVRNLF